MDVICQKAVTIEVSLFLVLLYVFLRLSMSLFDVMFFDSELRMFFAFHL